MNAEEKRKEAIASFGQLACNGLMMGLAYYGLRPLLTGHTIASDTVDAPVINHVFPIVDAIPWPIVGVVLCLGVFMYYLLKRVPRRVVADACREGIVEDTYWADVSR